MEISTTYQRFESPEVLDAMTDEVRGMLAQRIGESIYYRWVQLAGGLPRAQQKDYRAGIQQVEVNGDTATVALLGDGPNRIEKGEPGRDLRDTLLGPRVPVVPPRQGQRGKHASSKGGYYRAIPFRHQGPDSQGTHGSPMGRAYAGNLGAQEAGRLGRAIYKAAKALAPSTTEPFRVTGTDSKKLAAKGPGTRWGGRLRAGMMGIGKLRPHHKTDLYAGLVRLEKTFENATQGYLMTFRTISTRVTTGWHTQATEGAGLMKTIEQELPEMGREALQSFVSSLAGSTGSAPLALPGGEDAG